MIKYCPKVTIGIPTFNRADWLVQSIDSVLAQSYPNIEVIVSDNASTDNTREILAQYQGRIRTILQQSNLGMTRNWEECLNAATGEYFILLSDDDFLDPRAVELLVAGYGIDESTAFVYGRTAVHHPDGSISHHPVTPLDCENTVDFVMGCYLNRRFSPTGATLFKTSEIRSVGGYLANYFNLVPDAAVLMKIALLNSGRNIKFIDAVVFNYRVHSASTTNSTKMKIWIEEIDRLSLIVSERIMEIAPELKEAFFQSRDKYIISFVLDQARNNTEQIFIDRYNILNNIYKLCKPYLKTHSLKTFCFGLLFLLLPGFAQIMTSMKKRSLIQFGR